MFSRDDHLATVATVADEMKGQLIVNILNEHGITAAATGGFTSQFRAEAPGMVRVIVKQDNLSAAQAVLAQRVSLDAGFEPDFDDATDAEPSTGQPRLTRFVSWSLLLGELLAGLAIVLSWSFGGHIIGGLVALVVCATLVAAIVARRRFASR